MRIASFIIGSSLLAVAAPGSAQTAPAMPAPAMTAPAMTAPGSDAADTGQALSDKEQKALKRCQALPYAYQMQSSKCTNLMKKAGVKPVQPEQPRQ